MANLLPPGGFMFDSLADQIRRDEHLQISNTERYLRWVVVSVFSIVIFTGLYYAIRMLE
jgi:hypothetical protein